MPTEHQIDAAADMLMQLRMIGNTRPGDDLWRMNPGAYRQQLRARATDMLTIMLNQPAIFGEVISARRRHRRAWWRMTASERVLGGIIAAALVLCLAGGLTLALSIHRLVG
jgi:hypothetical protein